MLRAKIKKVEQVMSMRKACLALMVAASVTPALARDKTVNMKVSLGTAGASAGAGHPGGQERRRRRPPGRRRSEGVAEEMRRRTVN